MEQKASLQLLRTAGCFTDDPQALFDDLTGHGSISDTLLLETAEVDSKRRQSSLLLLRAALKIVCHGPNVAFTALTDNGAALLPVLADIFVDIVTHHSPSELHIQFAATEATLDENARLKAPGPLEALRQIRQLFSAHTDAEQVLLGGAFAFDLMAQYEPLPDVPAGPNLCPDFQFYLSEITLRIDHQQQSGELSACIFDPDCQSELAGELEQLAARIRAFSPVTPEISEQTPSHDAAQVDVSDEAFCAQVENLQQHIRAGDIFQVVPSRSYHLPCPDAPLAYRALKRNNPSPYMFYLNAGDFVLFGASPESSLKFDRHSRQVELYPIAGTRQRGFFADGRLNLDLDSRIELEMRQDQKELSEHLMLVDLARNDIARISEPGTRRVAELLKVDRYSQVMHLVSRVVGELRSDLDALHAYQACLNMGTLSGAPKVRATTLIRETEQQRRGSYGGAVGYINGAGDMDTCIVIRSAFVAEQQAWVQAGAGVVLDSVPQSEADETRNKAAAVVRAIAQANLTLAAQSETQTGKETGEQA